MTDGPEYSQLLAKAKWALSMETVTYSNVKIGDPSSRILTRQLPFAVDGIAAQQVSEGVWAYNLLPNQRNVTIVELPHRPDRHLPRHKPE